MSNRSIFEILSLNPNIQKDWNVIKNEYIPVDIHKVVIDGDVFTNYGGFQFIWEKSYIEEPKRSARGTLGNLNSQATFVTPHLILDFSIMSIDDYRAIIKKDLEKNEFVVECYDPIYNKKIKVKMYFSTLQMAKLFTINKIRFNGEKWEEFLELAGVHDYTVEMVGTNNELDLVSVIYHLNPPSTLGISDKTVGDQDVYAGEEIIIGGASDFQTETFGGWYKFKKWNTSPDGGLTGNYIDGYAYTINTDLVLYAQWQATEEHILTFNYGLSDPVLNNEEYEYENNRLVFNGASIGVLPTPKLPTVEYEDINGNKVKTTPYTNGEWWKVPQKVTKVDENGNNISETLKVFNNESFWANRDTTIYWLMDTLKYHLVLMVDDKKFLDTNVGYNENMNLPQIVKEGYTFDGWYTSTDRKINGKMPPMDLTLYAKWIKN
jgi:uncharacterized repeat protein (TIGR02543 family)